MDKLLINLSPLFLLIIFMYFFFIKPQKKREKDTETMRKTVQVGDEIITIGGICGKVVRTKEDSIVIQVGADKVKFEIMRWSVSSVVNRDAVADAKKGSEKKEDESAPKKSLPKKMKKAEDAKEETPVAPTAEAETTVVAAEDEKANSEA